MAGGATEMKKLILTALMATTPLYMLSIAAADQGTATDSTHFVKDSVITTKVKTKLAAKHMSTLTNIKVDTDDQGVVWLSGHAPTRDASDVAELTAKNTEGVTSVHNNIVIQP
jgi:hyperosmotically inducible periplasmic protein